MRFKLLEHVFFTEIALDELDAMQGIHFQQVKRNDTPLGLYALGSYLRPSSRCCTEVNNNLAWLLLTAQEHPLRNAERALTLARSATLIKERGYILDTLATAYWANGLIEEAVATEIRAFRLDPQNRAFYQAQMEKFRTKRWSEKE